MRRVLSYAIVTVAAVLLAVSCGKKARVIPRSTMSKIYLEMFLMDEWLLDNPQGLKSDTTLVYEPIFIKYGYTSDDYRESVSYYLQDPDRYARILRETSATVDAKLKELEARKAVVDAARKEKDRLRKYAPERIFRMTSLDNEGIFVLSDSVSVFIDTAGGRWDFDPQLGRDTVFRGPLIVIDSLSVPDTASVPEASPVVPGFITVIPACDVEIR